MSRNRNLKATRFLQTSTLLLALSFYGMGCEKKDAATAKPQAPEAAPSAAPSPAAAAAESTAPAPSAKPDAKGALDLTTDADGLSRSTIVMETTKGTIQYKFYSKDAPKTVKRIAELVQSGFYNGLTFHRVVPGFVIQGGDPQGNGMGGSGQKLPAEFNARKHALGTVAMARSQDPNSADSQFYIALADIPHLDGQYTVFGKVVSGIEVVQKITMGDKMTKVTIK
jgi:cyclophilin family peptidyl-prolyl cis-trans isomerase